MARTARDYRSIRGSAQLGTAPFPAQGPLARAEALAPGEMCRVSFAGELLGAARVRSRFVALPLEAFDRAGEVLAAEEQGAYFQLLRLAYGSGRNFCRVAKRDLMARLGLSERRLHRVLDGLVGKCFLRPLHRDNRGTLWRVYLPQEAFGEPVGDDVLLGRAGPAPAVAAPSPRPDGAARAEGTRVLPLRPPATGVDAELVRQLATSHFGGDLAAAAAELAALAADGATPRQLEAGVRAALRGARAARPDPPPPARGAVP